MKTYFYTDGKTNYGPFSPEELKGKGLNRDMLVWTETFSEWKKAGDVPELSMILGTLPPSINQQQGQKSSRKIIDILLFCSLLLWLFNSLMQAVLPLLSSLIHFEYYTIYPYYNLITTVIFMFVPIIIACSIENKWIKIIGIMVSIILAIIMLGGGVAVFDQMQKNFY